MTSDVGTRALFVEEPLRPSVQRFRLVMLRGPSPGATFDLDRVETRIGKGSDNEVVISDATVSRQHLSIIKSADAWMVRDLGSTNGTFLEETKIVEAYLKPGARIRAGQVLLRFQPVAAAVDDKPSERDRWGELLGTSPKTRQIFTLLDRIAPTDATVLLLGETGTGKGATARAIHRASKRADGPFVVIDCGAIAKTLIESELFGHERGAFTGAFDTRRGAMEVASGGTLFIDELDDLGLDVQPKLLRALEEREIHRVGSRTPIKLDLRVVAASKKDLRVEVAEGRFREDLYYRLSVVLVPLPPLRERQEDIPILVDHFLEREGSWMGLAKSVQDRLLNHTWPGNVRELRNLLERASYMGDLDDVDPAISPVPRPVSTPRAEPPPATSAPLPGEYARPFKEAKDALIARFEREYLRQLLERSKGNMARAARDAGIDRKYLYMLLKKHGLAPGDPSDAE